MQQLRALLGARDGFLGHGGNKMPHRKVTLLFPEQDEGQLAARLLDASLSLAHLLHVPLYVVDVSQRLRECRECGFDAASAPSPVHVCPWPNAEAQRHLQIAKQWQQNKFALPARRIPPAAAAAPRSASGQARSSKDAAAAAPAPAALPGDGMCNSWRKTKTCPRKDSGRQLCGFKHPEEYVVPIKHCFGFAKGHCQFGAGCKFPHVAAQQPASDAGAAVAAPAAAPAAPALPAASASIPAPSTDAHAVPLDPSWATAGMDPPASQQPVVPAAAAAAVAPAPAGPAPASQQPTALAALMPSQPEWQTVPASQGKKRKTAAETAAPTASSTVAVAANAWAFMVDEEEEKDAAAASCSSAMAVTPPGTPVVLQSSLSRLSSPSKAKSSKKQKGGDKKESAAAAAAASAGLVGEAPASVPPDKGSPSRSLSRSRPAKAGGSSGAAARVPSSSPARRTGSSSSHQ